MIKAAALSKNGKLQRNPILVSSHIPHLSLHIPNGSVLFSPSKVWLQAGLHQGQQKQRPPFAIFTLKPVFSVTQHVHGEFVRSDVCGDGQIYLLGSNGRHYYIKLRTWSCGGHPRLFRNNCLASCVEEENDLNRVAHSHAVSLSNKSSLYPLGGVGERIKWKLLPGRRLNA